MNNVGWLNEWQDRADKGDPDAQISLAWEYAAGDRIEKNFEKAEALFRRAEMKKPELARFYLAKAKLLNKDLTFVNDIVEDCKAGFGPSLYIMGAAAKDRSEAIRYFKLAAQNGHLVSEGFVWRLEQKSFLNRLATLPDALRILKAIVLAKLRDPRDIRILT